MTRYLLDTGSAGDYINGRRGVYERARAVALDGHRVGIAMPVLAELWYGVEKSSTRERNEQKLRRVLPEFIVWPLTVGNTDASPQCCNARAGPLARWTCLLPPLP